MVLIGFLGKSKTGKTLASEFLISKYNYKSRAFAYPLKKGVKNLFGFTEEQLNTEKKEMSDEYWGVSPRDILQIIGTDVVRNNFTKLFDNKIDGKNFWIKNFDKWYQTEMKKNNNPNINVVIPDVRFQNEVDYIKSKDGIVIKLHRTDIEKKKDYMYKHESELNINDIKNYDAIILNDDSIEKFYIKLDKLVMFEYNIKNYKKHKGEYYRYYIN